MLISIIISPQKDFILLVLFWRKFLSWHVSSSRQLMSREADIGKQIIFIYFVEFMSMDILV